MIFDILAHKDFSHVWFGRFCL